MADSKHPHEYMKYLREERLPHIFCPGCGNGIVLNTIFKGMELSDKSFETAVTYEIAEIKMYIHINIIKIMEYFTFFEHIIDNKVFILTSNKFVFNLSIYNLKKIILIWKNIYCIGKKSMY